MACLQTRVTHHGPEHDEIEVEEYSWCEMPHGEIRVRIPLLYSASSKQCRVDFKVNWLKVFAPAPDVIVGETPADAPPKVPMLDFQLYGAVNVDECIWEVLLAQPACPDRSHPDVCGEPAHARAVPHAWQLVNDNGTRMMIITLQRSPNYHWKTLYRENGGSRARAALVPEPWSRAAQLTPQRSRVRWQG